VGGSGFGLFSFSRLFHPLLFRPSTTSPSIEGAGGGTDDHQIRALAFSRHRLRIWWSHLRPGPGIPGSHEVMQGADKRTPTSRNPPAGTPLACQPLSAALDCSVACANPLVGPLEAPVLGSLRVPEPGRGIPWARGRLGAQAVGGSPRLPRLPGPEAEKARHLPGGKDGVHPPFVRETSSPCPGP
jgi:hypothetical protein